PSCFCELTPSMTRSDPTSHNLGRRVNNRPSPFTQEDRPRICGVCVEFPSEYQEPYPFEQIRQTFRWFNRAQSQSDSHTLSHGVSVIERFWNGPVLPRLPGDEGSQLIDEFDFGCTVGEQSVDLRVFGVQALGGAMRNDSGQRFF